MTTKIPKEVKDRIEAYIDETWRCWIEQEASMKKNGLRSMFEQIFEDGANSVNPFTTIVTHINGKKIKK